MSAVNLVLPMAGRGSRFLREGISQPKPLVDLAGKPFFWWAVESVRRVVPVEQMIFVVLEEHVTHWKLAECIREFYPSAEIVTLPAVTAGSAETAFVGVAALRNDLPVLINDCDHAFVASGLGDAAEKLGPALDGLLLTFRSGNANYSFVQLGPEGEITGTVEKIAASPYAIAGCYGFGSSELFNEQYNAYLHACPYPELFVSGMYNQMLKSRLRVRKLVLDEHFAFGTPEELASVRPRMESTLPGWQVIR